MFYFQLATVIKWRWEIHSQWTALPEGARDFTPKRKDSEAKPTSYSIGTEGVSPKGKAAGREADYYSPSSRAEFKTWVELKNLLLLYASLCEQEHLYFFYCVSTAGITSRQGN